MDNSLTIAEWLVARFPGAKKTTLREMVERKRVVMNGVAVKSLKQAVGPGDKVEVGGVAAVSGGGVGGAVTVGSNGGTIGKMPIPRGGLLAEGLKLVYQDADILVVDKPGGLLTSTHSAEPRPTVGAIMEAYVQRTNQKAQAMVVHRLDRDASGLLVLARNEKAYEHLKDLFSKHAIERRYIALVHGVFRNPQGKLEHLLFQDERGLVHVTKEGKAAQARRAAMTYKVLGATAKLTRVECTLETGRKHQIRVQLKSIGHPICGDPVYGTRDAQEGHEPPGRLALHATHLAFAHPKGGKTATFASPVPPAWVRMVP